MAFTVHRARAHLTRRSVGIGAAIGLVLGTVGGGIVLSQRPGLSLAGDAVSGRITGFADKCVDVDEGNPASGTRVQLYDCNGTEAQQWTNPGDGTLRAFGKCLDVRDGSTADAADVQLWDCNGTAAQQWVITEAKDIVNPAADKCLDVRAYNSANRTPLQIWPCQGAANEKWNVTAGGSSSVPAPERPAPVPEGGDGGFVVSQAQFDQMFPQHNPVYTYEGLRAALSAYPAFATSGDDAVKKREAAAFLANVNHETGGLVHVVEQNTANYPAYCDASQPYGCPAGQAAYYGRGPIQLSWNYNYKAAGDALGIDLLNNPGLVESDSSVAWKTGLWYWNTQSGPGSMTPHDAVVNNAGFGQTVRSINGALECDGKYPAEVQSRVDSYLGFTRILGVDPGGSLSC
ncbi:glycoside hydrolase family 19 protein [Streptomyces sp. DSM 41014]|uniref:Glycoside hydrolase family 19 protein n=1 Tax=Streptomyces hintoniae TaxID=3075521 RepID=A0ABU2ULC7_9ACTN|nr:glycoside hydrolase family 19 protein [Streptomyces sp. DSM 41014]MDT0473999.1 glycoside hydrolase family 19 protein [Streptomyces sp. DSM 41014]